jgi:hypothetical protein
MADLGADVKRSGNLIKDNPITFVVAGLVLVILAFWYEHKNPGAVSGKLAKIPFIGPKLFS